MKFELRPARPADVEAIMQVMADAMANLQHPEWFVPDDAVYMAEHISGPKGFCLVAEEKTTGALAAYFTVKLAGTAPDALGWQLGMSEEELNTTAQMDSCCVAPPYQGNGLEGKLLLMAEDTLRGSRYRHLLATVHPDNAASLYTGLHRGYTIAANHVICYGDKVRNILYKELESRNTNMNTTIRAMTPADKDSVMEMMRVFYNSPAVLSNGSDEIFARDIEGCISDNPYVEGYMFEQDGAVQGYGMAAKSFSTEYGRQCIWLEDIYIKAEYRGLGIGSQFIDYITKKYPDALLRLEVEEENARAVHVYKKSGFEFFEYKKKKQPKSRFFLYFYPFIVLQFPFPCIIVYGCLHLLHVQCVLCSCVSHLTGLCFAPQNGHLGIKLNIRVPPFIFYNCTTFLNRTQTLCYIRIIKAMLEISRNSSF